MSGLRTNVDKLVMQSVGGTLDHPKVKNGSVYRISAEGFPHVVPWSGAVTFNYNIGDCCMDLPGDHVEPGATLKNHEPLEDIAFNNLTCIGNEATVMSGDAKGAKGYITGKHGGINHVMCYFSQDTYEKLTYDDKILVRAYGVGLELLDYPQIKCMNLSPFLLERLNIREKNGILQIPVSGIVPAYLMGSGLGVGSMFSGDYDIMTRDKNAMEKNHLENLRFGDIVMIEDHHCMFGPDYRKGARTLGVIIHSDSFKSGHGPGVTVLMTSVETVMEPVLDKNANLKNYFPDLG